MNDEQGMPNVEVKCAGYWKYTILVFFLPLSAGCKTERSNPDRVSDNAMLRKFACAHTLFSKIVCN
jgi:hypothetical protein